MQIKAGQSYIKSGRFYTGADRDHFETWARYAIPGAGIVLDPSSSEARWSRAWEFDPKAEPRQGVAEGEKEYTSAVAERLATWSNTEKTITPNGESR